MGQRLHEELQALSLSDLPATDAALSPGLVEAPEAPGLVLTNNPDSGISPPQPRPQESKAAKPPPNGNLGRPRTAVMYPPMPLEPPPQPPPQPQMSMPPAQLPAGMLPPQPMAPMAVSQSEAMAMQHVMAMQQQSMAMQHSMAPPQPMGMPPQPMVVPQSEAMAMQQHQLMAMQQHMQHSMSMQQPMAMQHHSMAMQHPNMAMQPPMGMQHHAMHHAMGMHQPPMGMPPSAQPMAMLMGMPPQPPMGAPPAPPMRAKHTQPHLKGNLPLPSDSNGVEAAAAAGDWRCTKCGNVNFAFRMKCNRCHVWLPRSVPQVQVERHIDQHTIMLVRVPPGATEFELAEALLEFGEVAPEGIKLSIQQGIKFKHRRGKPASEEERAGLPVIHAFCRFVEPTSASAAVKQGEVNVFGKPIQINPAFSRSL